MRVLLAFRLAVVLVVALVMAALPAGPQTRLARAGPDVCPEPNDTAATACFLGPAGPASGHLDTPADVDLYRVELPPDAMLVATLSSLPADYSLRLLLPDASVKAEAPEPGLQDKVIKADGVPPGAYYLAVFSQRGGADPEQPYVIAVSYPASLVLTVPSGSGGPTEAYGYVPPPARSYVLSPADVGPGFREIGRNEQEGGRFYRVSLLGDGARLEGDPFGKFTVYLSGERVSLVQSLVWIAPYGDNVQLEAWYNRLLGDLRQKYGAIVEPTQGWGSEQVYSYAWPGNGYWVRGIVLRHRNAVAFVETFGLDFLATWDHISSLMRITERRIWDAAQ